jgi:AraC-like DNA-binding protein
MSVGDPASVFLSATRAAFIGPALDLGPHANAVATLAVGISEPFRLSVGRDGDRAETIALIAPGVRHHLRAEGTMAFVYLDALSDEHESLRGRDLDGARAGLLEYLDLAAPPSIAGMLAAIGIPPRSNLDVRVSEVAALLSTDPDRFALVREAAAHVGLSDSHFQRLFRAGVGVPYRRFRVWCRMVLAVTAVASGRSLTEAAHEAGFASSAHLSSSFREMFGLAPSHLLALPVQFHIEHRVDEGGSVLVTVG